MMDGWTDSQTDRTDGWKALMDRQMDEGVIDRLVDGWMDKGWMRE